MTAAARADTVVIVDGTNVLIRSYFAYPDLLAPSGAPTGAAYGVLSRVREAVDAFRPRRVAVAWDGGRSAWRRAVYPGYKVRPRSDGRADLSGCFAQRPVVRELLASFGVDQVDAPGVEADDLVAAGVETAAGPVVVLSTDRDFYQLVRDGVSVYDGAARDAKNVTASTFAAVVGRTPEEWHAYRIVNGDASDAVPRVKGLSGEKRFDVVWPVLCAMGYDGDALDFFLAGDPGRGVGAATQSLRGRYDRKLLERTEAAVAEHWHELVRNTLLMDLGFALGMLPAPVRGWLRTGAGVTRGAWDARAAELLCGRLNFQSVLRRWGEWSRAFDGVEP